MMLKTALNLDGCFVFEPRIYEDNRGSFFEFFKKDFLTKEADFRFDTAQVNFSTSKKGVLRGIHFAIYPPGQAKFVSCLSGKIFDVVVDLRIGSKTFGKWDSVILDSKNPRMLLVPYGFGHSFLSLEEDSKVIYLCDQEYNSLNEKDIDPFDNDLKIIWPEVPEFIQSEKDCNSMSFKDAIDFMPHINNIN